MRRHRALLGAVLVGALLASGGWWVLRAGDSAPAARRESAVDVARVEPGRAVHVESGEPRTTFLPLGPGPHDGRTLSAQRAYNVLVGDSAKLQLMPATVQAYYGVLSAPDAVGGVGDVRVWAFVSESGCSDATTGRCRLWEFVDARTGRDLGVVTQEVLPD
jgi:hypothetical protein